MLGAPSTRTPLMVQDPSAPLRPFRDILRDLCKRHDKTPTNVGDAVKVSARAVEDWLRKVKPALPQIDKIKPLCDLFNVSPYYLLGLSPDENPPRLIPGIYIGNDDLLKKLEAAKSPQAIRKLLDRGVFPVVRITKATRVIKEDEYNDLRAKLGPKIKDALPVRPE